MDLEFGVCKEQLPFEYDLERIIDDFIFMGILIGNDFLPLLPAFYIPNGLFINFFNMYRILITLSKIIGGLTVLYDCYKKILPSLGGYLLDFGKINLERCSKFFLALCEHEKNFFEGKLSDTRTQKRREQQESIESIIYFFFIFFMDCIIFTLN